MPGFDAIILKYFPLIIYLSLPDVIVVIMKHIPFSSCSGLKIAVKVLSLSFQAGLAGELLVFLIGIL